MSTPRDIAQLPDDAKNFLRRQGISLNPLVWHGRYRYPDDAKRFEPERTCRRFYLLKSNTGFEFLTRHSNNKRGIVYDIRLSEGIGGPKPAAPRVQLNRPKAEVVDDTPLPPGTPGVDQAVEPELFAHLRFTYPDGSGVVAPFTITTESNTFDGTLVSGDTRKQPLNTAGEVTYTVGTPVSTSDWHAELDRLEEHCHTLADARDDTSDIQTIPHRLQPLHLINTRVLMPGDPADMPTELFSAGYPFAPLFDTAATLWTRQRHRPDRFQDAFRNQCPLEPVVLSRDVGMSLGLSTRSIRIDTVSRCLLDLIHVLSDEAVMQPLVTLADEWGYAEAETWALEAALVALLSHRCPVAAANQAGNSTPYHVTLSDIGRSLSQLAEWMRQQAKVLNQTAPDSRLVTATLQVPDLSTQWPTVPQPNWVELNYDDSDQPFPTGTRLAYWLYDDNDELLYQGEDLTPGEPKRFLLPDEVQNVSYRFAYVPKRIGVPEDQTTFDSLFPIFGEPIVHLYDVGLIVDVEPGLPYTSRTNTGRTVQLRPVQVDLLKRALEQINLPEDEYGHPQPNTYVLLANADSTNEDIRAEIEHQLGSGLTEDDWALIGQQLAPLNPAEPKILDLTWLYADLLFRAAAERYEDPEVQKLIQDLEELEELKENVPRDPWWLRYNLFPTEEKFVTAVLKRTKNELENRLDDLYEAQKDANLIPYRHVNRELLQWIDQALFTVATFFVPIEGWLIHSGQAFLALLRSKYFIGGAALGLGAYSGDAQAGRFTTPELTVAKGAVRATAAKTLCDDAVKYGLQFKGVNAPTHLALDGSVGPVRQRLVGEVPEALLPPAPNGHHWYRSPNGSYNTKRNPGYNGPRKEYDHEERRFYESGKHKTTPGTNRFKAEFAEDAAYDYMEKQGHEVLPGFRRPTYGQHGIDGIFLNANPPPTYVIIEAKYHKSSYGSISGPDGQRFKQMSDPWILNKAERQVDEDVLMAIESGDYEKYGLRYRPDLDRVVREEITW